MTLHWILLLTVTLQPCLSAYINAHHVLKDVQGSIKILQNSTCNESDSTFYSPSGTSGCTNKALQCSFLELKTVATECFEKGSRPFKHVHRARDNIECLLNATDTGEAQFQHCFCESENPAEMSYKEFIDNLKNLVQMMSSSWNPKIMLNCKSSRKR